MKNPEFDLGAEKKAPHRKPTQGDGSSTIAQKNNLSHTLKEIPSSVKIGVK